MIDADKELRELAEKATPGPWKLNDGLCATGVFSHHQLPGVSEFKIVGHAYNSNNKGENDLFAIANAPTDIQALLAEVRGLTERLQYEETCHAEAVQEVKRLNRMVDCSIWWHENCSDCDVCHRKLDCSLLGCGNAWRKYLESEVAE